MNKQNKAHVIVVGMGMAGLMAAYSAAKRGKDVTLMGAGLGALSIASGCVDVLGYVQDGQSMKPVQKPLEALTALPAQHPYSLIGRESVEQALLALQELCKEQGADFIVNDQQNTLVPTIIGTLKPTYFYPAASNSAPLFQAKKASVVSVDVIRDCHPHLIIQQLQKYAKLKHIDFDTAYLNSNLGLTHRAVSPLDVARYVDSPEGYTWIVEQLTPLAKSADVIILPPILGASINKNTPSPWKKLQAQLNCPLVEMLSLPPGVGGNRLLNVLMQSLRELGVRIVENANIVSADIQNGHCKALISKGEGVEHRHEAQSFILATGGILGGGISTKPGKAYETILGIELETPEKQEEWADVNAFGTHAFTTMGVVANSKLQPINARGQVLVDNIYFIGRSLGAYDFATEKSGNGVALATGWYAGESI